MEAIKSLLSWPAVLLASSMGIVFAQSAVPQRIPYSQEAALAACLGAMIWIIKRLLTRTIPDLEKNFRNSLDAINARHDKALETINARSERHNETFNASMAQFHEIVRSITKE